MTVIIFATRNKGKQAEILKVAVRYNLQNTINFPEDEYPESKEEHDTFEGNAWQKAADAAAHFHNKKGVLFVGDDSGMEIPSLGGEPGVRTRRWGGRKLTDQEFDTYCLLQLKDKQGSERDAILKTTLCALIDDKKQYFYGTLHGTILTERQIIAAEKPGFPIAALFYIPSANSVLGNIQDSHDSPVKSHRERALEQLFEYVATL
jgi:Xanthosine triphosphate pyrophosphatase